MNDIADSNDAKWDSVRERVENLIIKCAQERLRAEAAESALKTANKRLDSITSILRQQGNDYFHDMIAEWMDDAPNSVCAAPACDKPNPEPAYGEGVEAKE